MGITSLCERRSDYVEVRPATIEADASTVNRLLDEGKRVLIPYDHYACEVLRNNNVKFVVVLPQMSMKQEMRQRSLFNAPEGHWEDLLHQVSTEECYTRVILTKTSSYLSDLVVYIENLFKGSN